MGWFAKWRLNRAAKQYARRLPRRLRQGWGGSKTYTRGQIDTAVRDLRLDPRYVFIAYAVFLPPEDTASSETEFAEFTAAEVRAAFASWRTLPTSWGANSDYDGSFGGDSYGGGHGHGDGGGHH
jgi:hypothetical protein